MLLRELVAGSSDDSELFFAVNRKNVAPPSRSSSKMRSRAALGLSGSLEKEMRPRDGEGRNIISYAYVESVMRIF